LVRSKRGAPRTVPDKELDSRYGGVVVELHTRYNR